MMMRMRQSTFRSRASFHSRPLSAAYVEKRLLESSDDDVEAAALAVWCDWTGWNKPPSTTAAKVPWTDTRRHCPVAVLVIKLGMLCPQGPMALQFTQHTRSLPVPHKCAFIYLLALNQPEKKRTK